MLSKDKPTQMHKELYLMEANSPIVAFKEKREYLKYIREIFESKNSKTIDINTYTNLCRNHGRQKNKANFENIKNLPDIISRYIHSIEDMNKLYERQAKRGKKEIL